MEVIFEDDSIIVCYKPAGLPTQTKSVAMEDLETKLKKHRAEHGEKPEIFIIHRLDQPVEGLVVVAKNAESAAKLSKQVIDHTFAKKYYAVISNIEFPDEGELVDYLLKDGKTNLAIVSNKSNTKAKKASLKYKVIDEWANRKLLDIDLFSGRHHQIRIQLASRNAAIVGDVKYGGIKTNRALALCSHYVEFKHPITGKKMEFDIRPKGEDFIGSYLLK